MKSFEDDIFLQYFDKSKTIKLIVDSFTCLIIRANQAASDFYAYPKDVLLGMHVSDLCSIVNEEEIHLHMCENSDDSAYTTFHKTAEGIIKKVEVNLVRLSFAEKILLCLEINDISNEEILKNNFLKSQNKFRYLLDNIPFLAVQGYRKNGITFYWNKASEKLYGYSAQEAIGKKLTDLIIPEAMKEDVGKLTSQLASGQYIPADELQLLHKNGSTVDVFSSHAIISFEGEAAELYCIDIDISERKIAERLRLAANVFSNANEPILITDANAKILDINYAFSEYFGYTKEELIEKTPNIIKSDYHDRLHYQEMWKLLLEKGMWKGEVWNKRKNGDIFPALVNINAVKDKEGNVQNYVGFFTDLTYMKQYEEELKKAALFDKLTGLPNRTLFYNRLEHAIIQSKRSNEAIALYYIDLDGFKKINDTYGHLVGDQFLIEISKKIHMQLRETDTLARIGGDEFICIAEVNSLEHSYAIAKRILEGAKQTIIIDEKELSVSASVGIALCYPEDNIDNIDLLIRKADEAMYIAKNSGKNQFYISFH